MTRDGAADGGEHEEGAGPPSKHGSVTATYQQDQPDKPQSSGDHRNRTWTVEISHGANKFEPRYFVTWQTTSSATMLRGPVWQNETLTSRISSAYAGSVVVSNSVCTVRPSYRPSSS